MDILFNKYHSGWYLDFDSKVICKNKYETYNIIYEEIKRLPKDIIQIIMKYYSKPTIKFKYYRNIFEEYTYTGSYVTMFIYKVSCNDETLYCHININKNIGIQEGNFIGKYPYDSIGIYDYFVINGYGETYGYELWDNNNDREKNVRKFLKRVNKFLRVLYTIKIVCYRHINGKEVEMYGGMQLNTGYEIQKHIGKYIKIWNNKKRDLDSYYVAAIHCDNECVIKLTKFEFECIKLEMREMETIIQKMRQ